MSRVIRYRERRESVTYGLFFPHEKGKFSSGFCFDCDEGGNVNVESLNPVARSNYEMCIRDRQGWQQVMTFRNSYWDSGLIKCDCGEEIETHSPGADVYCEKCRREYNSSGQLLAHRSQWGKETGETHLDYDQGFAGYPSDY